MELRTDLNLHTLGFPVTAALGYPLKNRKRGQLTFTALLGTHFRAFLRPAALVQRPGTLNTQVLA